MATTDKRKMVERIRGLLALAGDAGATEAEAQLAAEKAQELMLRYAIEDTDLESAERDIYLKRGADGQENDPARLAKWGIARLCRVRAWYASGYGKSGSHIFFGEEGDVDLAHYFLAMVNNVLESEWKRYLAQPEVIKAIYMRKEGDKVAAQKVQFQRGMATRLGERFNELADKTDVALESSGNALVVRA